MSPRARHADEQEPKFMIGAKKRGIGAKKRH
jgi:hypothetical protein